MKKKDWAGFTAALADKSGNNGKSASSFETPAWEVNLFKPVLDDKGSATILMRLLPMPDGELTPYVEHGQHKVYADKGRYLKEPCPHVAKLGKCPICEKRNSLYNTNKYISDKLRVTKSWYANVLIVKNPNDPESEGRVFLLKYGKGIYDKIMTKIAPENPELEVPVNVFDYEEGANFLFKIKTVEVELKNQDGSTKKVQMPNYDASEFQAPSKISLGGKVLTAAQVEELETKLSSIANLVAEKHYKTYEELAALADKLLGVEYGFGGEGFVPAGGEQWSIGATVETAKSDPFAATTDYSKTASFEESPVSESSDEDDDLFKDFR